MKLVSQFIVLLFMLSECVVAQTVPPLPASDIQLPHAMMECESNQCAAGGEGGGTWVFHGSAGEAQWRNGDAAKLVIERFDAGGIDIRRIDVANSSSYGLTAVYTGKLRGDRIEGSVVWSWNGHWDGRHPSGPWSATVQNVSPVPPPAVAIQIPSSLTECEGNQCASGREGGCAWVFHGSGGEARCRNGAVAKLIIQQADSDAVIIRRTDLPNSLSYGLTAVYTGTLHGNRLTGYATWSWPGHWEDRNPSARWFATVRDLASQGLPPIPPPLVSPDLHADGRVTFRFLDPNALEVFLELEGAKPMMMQKNEAGLWSVTTVPLKQGNYGYQFRADDVALMDPSNPVIMPNLVYPKSMVHVLARPNVK